MFVKARGSCSVAESMPIYSFNTEFCSVQAGGEAGRRQARAQAGQDVRRIGAAVRGGLRLRRLAVRLAARLAARHQHGACAAPAG